MKKRIYNLEKELDRDNSESFIYELNKNAVFNIQKFEYLVQSIEEYLENSVKTTEKSHHLWIKNEIIIIFEHTLWSIACHYMPNDLFFIKNINEIEEKLPDYYQTIRIYSEKIIFNQ